MVFARVVINAFRMEIFGAVGSGALSGFIFPFVLGSDFLFLKSSNFPFTFFRFLVLNSVVIPLLFANKTGNHVVLAVLANEINFHTLF
jgi:hypothetical protein